MDDECKKLYGLMDFSFTEFFTIKVIKQLYFIAIAIAAISALTIIGTGFATGTAMSIIGGIIMAPIAFILYIIFARISLELIVVAFHIADNTKRLVEIAECCEEDICDDETCESHGAPAAPPASSPASSAPQPEPAPEEEKKPEDEEISL